MSDTNAPGASVPDNVCLIECKNKTHKVKGTQSKRKAWSPCDYKQFCAKLEEVKQQLKDEELERTPKRAYKLKKERRIEGNLAASEFWDDWHERPRKPAADRKKFYDDCAFEESKSGTEMDAFSPDHRQEIQLGGDPADFANLVWLKEHVNQSVGSHLRSLNPKVHTEIRATCCPVAAD